MFYITGVVLLSALSIVTAKDVPNSWPQNYTGIPSGDFSPQWQSYFEVKDPLPNVTNTLPRSFAGSISTNRAGHANDSLFFWGFEKENGSLTAADGELINEPWLIWLNGGPGASSFLGFFLENGPLQVKPDYTIVQNNYSWSKQLDAFWLDQPVGTGFSTADSDGGYAANQEQMAEDFLAFLSNLVKVFPSLAERPFFLTGESYAGRYIPYIAKAIFSSRRPPVNLRKLAIGDGAIGSFAGYEELPTVSVLETYPQIINFDTDVYNYFKTQEHLCKYDLNLTYPQRGHFPSLIDPRQTSNLSYSLSELKAKSVKSSWHSAIAQKFAKHNRNSNPRARNINKREEKRQQWKRDLIGRPNGTLDPHYGCFLWEEMTDYAVNFSFPWTNGGFDPYFIPDALNPEVTPDPSVFMNDNRTRTALHAPRSKDWAEQINYPWGSTLDQLPGTNEFGDPSVESAAFFTELAANASAHNVSIIIYSGNDDALVAHLGSEVVIQNTTFGGIQGFTRKPSTPWYGDDGSFAGIVHQERNLTYVFFIGAGHEVPEYQPANAYVFLREYVIGSNTTGLVLPNSTVVGGEDPKLAGDIIPGTSVIFYGSSTTVSSTVAPSASLAAWASFLATATPTKGF